MDRRPLAENAVRHGLSRKPGLGTVSIVARDAGAECLITVEDDGVGMDPVHLARVVDDPVDSGVHVGLANVDERLRAAFGDSFGLVVDTAPGGGDEGDAAGAQVLSGGLAGPGRRGDARRGRSVNSSSASGLLTAVAGVLSTDIVGRGSVRDSRVAAIIAGMVPLVLALRVSTLDVSLVVGLAFAVAASSFCPPARARYLVARPDPHRRRGLHPRRRWCRPGKRCR